MTAAEQSLSLWIPQVVGRYINEDWNPENKGFGAQCWDTAANWSKYLGLPVISTGGKGRWPGWAGNMVDAFPQSAAIAAAYELIGPDEPGVPGDIPVWGDGYYYYPKTHVAVLVKDIGAQLLCISQNSSASLAGNPYPEWTTGPTILQHLPRRGLIGFIRPRTGLAAQGTTTQTSEEDEMTQEQIDLLIDKLDKLNAAHHVATREHVNGKIPDIAAAVWTHQIDHRNAAGELEPDATTPETVLSYMDFNNELDRSLVKSLRSADPARIAAAISAALPGDLAARVVAELGKQLGGK